MCGCRRRRKRPARRGPRHDPEETLMELLVISIIKIVLVLLIILTTVANLVYAERRISAFIQNRIGPNRVGPWGLLQAPADVLKLFIKEDIVPVQANPS